MKRDPAEVAAAVKKRSEAVWRQNAPKMKAICACLLKGASRREAYTTVGVNHETFYSWMQKRPEFKAAVEEAESKAVLDVEHLLKRCAMKAEEDPAYQKSMEFFLKSNRPEKYRNDETMVVAPQMPSITFTVAPKPDAKEQG